MRAQKTHRPFVPVLVAWLLPGGGHWIIGRPWPALFVAGGVLPLFLLGLHMTGWEIVSPTRHPYYAIAHVWAGLPALFAWLLNQDTVVTTVLPFEQTGRLYTAVAGMLNLMAIADVWARCKRGDPDHVEAIRPEPMVGYTASSAREESAAGHSIGGAGGEAP